MMVTTIAPQLCASLLCQRSCGWPASKEPRRESTSGRPTGQGVREENGPVSGPPPPGMLDG